MPSLLENGAYSFSEAALYTKLRTARVREWFSGNRQTPVFSSDYGDETEQPLISFYDLVEVFIAGQLREHGVSLRTIRQSHAALATKWGIKHPFCRKELCILRERKRKSVLFSSLNETQQAEIYEVLTTQRVFPEIIQPFLKRLNYDEATSLATLWRLADGVELNPAICFGKPIVSDSKKPTYLLSAAYEANGRSEDAVARWYGVTKDDVMAAVAFEASLSA